MKIIPIKLLFLALVVASGCGKETKETATDTMPDTPVEPTETYYKAIFKIDGAHAQDQYYQYEKLTNGFEIKEVSRFLSDSTIVAKARLKFFNNEYEEVEINFDNGNISSDVLVQKQRPGVYYSFKNNVLVDSIVNTSEMVLFDGPNPSFDWVNCEALLANLTTAQSTLVLINWVTGSLSTEDMTLTKTEAGYTIQKDDTQRLNTIILNEEVFSLEESQQNTEEHLFTTLDSKPRFL